LIEYFGGLEEYHSWRGDIVKQDKIPDRGERTPAHAEFFSNRLTFKYEPTCFIDKMADKFEEKGFIELSGQRIEDDSFRILKKVMKGESIRTNYSYIGRELGVNRKTVKRRIDDLLDKGIIEKPKCFFPNLFVPPGYNLIITLIEATSDLSDIKDYLKKDENVPMAIETSTERYNFLVFSAFESIEEFFEWGEKLNAKHPDNIGAISKTILSSRMVHLIEPQKVSLGFIENKLWDLKS
ncbi:MAG: Lrp/AsnC family transcriptional regulator, partial [Candidatus Thermoplasmatota archaeon]|nr:Lrp/AsnC family transcriptional regulator [Candidatus Thermoplasmatota archaeon]